MPKVEDKYDVVIIGSGFGGSAAAYKLSKAGHTVLVIEKGDWDGDPHSPNLYTYIDEAYKMML